MAVMIEAIPASVKIGAFDVAIEQMDSLTAMERQEYGSFSGLQFKIRVQVGDVPERKVAHTLLHEISHAIYRFWQISGEEEEPIVTKFAYGLAAVWRDNPALMRWIDQALTAP